MGGGGDLRCPQQWTLRPSIDLMAGASKRAAMTLDEAAHHRPAPVVTHVRTNTRGASHRWNGYRSPSVEGALLPAVTIERSNVRLATVLSFSAAGALACAVSVWYLAGSETLANPGRTAIARGI